MPQPVASEATCASKGLPSQSADHYGNVPGDEPTEDRMACSSSAKLFTQAAKLPPAKKFPSRGLAVREGCSMHPEDQRSQIKESLPLSRPIVHRTRSSSHRHREKILMVLDATKDDAQRQLLTKELNDVGIRLNKARPKISVTKTKTGGFKFNATCTLTESL
ncbi:Drg2 [Symbiodinium sp. CCMP2592]|nr:Drg2 [Symbiodinium sp. CCMP2592]